MASPFLSEIRLVSFDFPPEGWAFANGQLLSIQQYQPLFSLLGTTYGGDGRITFALPDLRGRVPLHFGAKHSIGEASGQEGITLTIEQMPRHSHYVGAVDRNNENNNNPIGNYLSNTLPNNFYSNTSSNQAFMNQTTVSSSGQSQAHSNMQPFLTLSFIIALVGIFPSQT